MNFPAYPTSEVPAMRLPRFRFTVRRMMVAVAVVAVILGAVPSLIGSWNRYWHVRDLIARQIESELYANQRAVNFEELDRRSSVKARGFASPAEEAIYARSVAKRCADKRRALISRLWRFWEPVPKELGLNPTFVSPGAK